MGYVHLRLSAAVPRHKNLGMVWRLKASSHIVIRCWQNLLAVHQKMALSHVELLATDCID